jgi:superfamily II DNA/RNA helicase
LRVEVTPQGTTAAEIHRERGTCVTKAGKRVVLVEAAGRPGDERASWSSPAPSTAPTASREDLDRDDIHSHAIHGNKSQNNRQNALNGLPQPDRAHPVSSRPTSPRAAST